MRVSLSVAVLLAAALCVALLFRHLSYPLLWHDEALTAVFAERVLEVGYPKVHGSRNANYPMHHDLSVGIREGLDAYIGSPWAQYYFAAPGVAWAAGVEDLYAKTLRVRLPFAAAGAAGVALLLWTAIGSLRGALRRRAFALCALGLLAWSVSLQLHLREVRYYSLVIALAAGALHLTVRRRLRHDLGAAAYTLGVAGCLVLLFNTFYLAFAGLGLGLGLHALGSALRRGVREGGLRRLASDLLPLALAGLAVIPFAVFYDTLAVGEAFSHAYTGPKNAYANKLVWLVEALLRYEFLAPALGLRLAVAALRLGRGDEAPELRERLRLADLLAVVAVCYAVVVAAAPFFYERYSLLLSPLLVLLLLLDAFALVDLLHDGAPAALRRGLAVGLGAMGAVVLALVLAMRAPELAGRVHELRHVYRGPLDFLVPYLKEAYPDPARLVIATNYEDPSLRYYLGARVIVGWFNPHVARDLLFEPDVIVPRPGGKHRDALAYLARRGHFAERRFEVADVPANNVPSLAPWNHARWVHRFRTPSLDEEGARPLVILERVDDTADPPRRARDSGAAPDPSAARPE